MEAYLDNAATAKCSRRAAELMMKILTEDYGNPSSLHSMGEQAEHYIKNARKKIAKTLKAEEKEIIFTSGGTEANNLAILGAAEANRRAGNHIITTAIEHASIEQPMQRLEELGYRITYLPADASGIFLMEALEDALDEETILVSLIHVNNEIGSIQPIADAARLIQKKAKGALLHTDAIQSYGKLLLHPKTMGVDLLSASGHKIHGPKGSGFLYVRNKTKIKPILFGGGQQDGMRSGTENVPAIAGLGEAAEEIYENFEEKTSRIRGLKNYFIREMTKMPDVIVNGASDEASSPYIVSLGIEGIRSEALLHALEERGVFVSSGSACSSNKPSISRTLQAIGVKRNLLDSSVRFSFCKDTSKEEIDYALECLNEAVLFQRRFIRR